MHVLVIGRTRFVGRRVPLVPRIELRGPATYDFSYDDELLASLRLEVGGASG